MKLPADQGQRVKVYVMFALAGALVLLGLVQGIFQPLRRAYRQKQERLRECLENIRAAQAEIARESRDRQRRQTALARLRELSERYLLHPVLGNYALRASEFLESEATRLGLSLDPLREVGMLEFPRAQPRATRRYFSVYAARVTLACGYHDLVRFLEALEAANPYLCIVNLSITGDASVDPERHRIGLELHWLIWGEDRPTDLLRERERGDFRSEA